MMKRGAGQMEVNKQENNFDVVAEWVEHASLERIVSGLNRGKTYIRIIINK